MQSNDSALSAPVITISSLIADADYIVSTVSSDSASDSDTLFYLASTLHQSLESLGTECEGEVTRDKVYWLTYEAYHLANAFYLLSPKPHLIENLRGKIEHIHLTHAPDFVGVAA